MRSKSAISKPTVRNWHSDSLPPGTAAMDIENLRALIAVIDEGGITQASAVLCRVPSAVTSRIRALEQELGVLLFKRQNRKMIPTSAGLTLYRDARTIVKLVDDAKRRLTEHEPGGLLRIGALDSIAGSRLPSVLSALLQRWPTVELQLTVGISRTLLDDLHSRRIDVALLVDAPADERLFRRPVFNETLCLIAASGHRPIRTPADLETSCVLAFHAGCSYRDRILRWFSSHDARPEKIIEVASYATIIGSVAAGMGVAVVPHHLLATTNESVSVHPLQAPLGHAQVELVAFRDAVSPNVRALDELLPQIQEAQA